MSNNKQSSVEMMWDEIDNLFPFKDSEELQKFCAILDKYKAMHKEECIKYYVDSTDYGDMGQHIRESFIQIAEKMYNETFGGNNEKI